MQFQILFNQKGPIPLNDISQAVNAFPKGYTETVHKIIEATNRETINRDQFIKNSVDVLKSFKMTRQGPFKGLGYKPDGSFKGPIEKIDASWEAVKDELIEIKKIMNSLAIVPRGRSIALMDERQFQDISDMVWSTFKKLLPITMTTSTFGMVGASKILFSVFPEIVLPVDTAEWKQVFKTLDLGDVIKLMRSEILEWEKQTGQWIDSSEPANVPSTLPAIYNVMAMKARHEVSK